MKIAFSFFIRPIFAVTLALTMLLSIQTQAQQQTIEGTLQTPQPDDSTAPPAPPKYTGPVARGRVFTDRDNDSKFSQGDGVFIGARVSNGIDIVKTDDQGTVSYTHLTLPTKA